METLNITRYEVTVPGPLDDFVEMIHSIEFKYNTGHLLMAGMEAGDIAAAIGKAMTVCNLNNIDTADHFRSFYISDEANGNTGDWRMTRQGFMLVIFNAPATTQAIAQCQWEMINSLATLH